MATGLWLLTALVILVSGGFLAFTSSGYRILLVGCVVIGLTPLGFVAGAEIPVYLPEILIAMLAFGVMLSCYKQLPDVRIPWFFLLFGGYFALQVFFAAARGEASIIDLIRSARPLAFIMLLLLLIEILRQVSISRHVTEYVLARVVIVCVIADIVFYIAAYFGFLSIGGISGEFFARTGLVRYMDLMTMSLFGLANYFMYASRLPAKSLFWLLVCAVIGILSVNRIYMIGSLIGMSWWLSMAIRARTNLRFVSLLAGVSPLIALVVAGVIFTRSQPEAGEVVSRATELFDLPLLISALKYRFVDPALMGGYELTLLSFFFGEGIGLKFYVPWFEYRGLDPWHFSVDSLFAFAFFKYGILGVFFLCLAITRMLWNRPWDISNAWMWLYLVVHSGINVPSFLLFMIILVILRDGSWLVSRGDNRDYPLPATRRS